LNVWTFSGRCAADAELRSTQNGEQVLSFRVANDVGFGNNKTTQWVDCSYWGKRAASVATYVRKGDRITVSGELRLEEYTARDGSAKSKLAVRVNDLDLASKAEGGSASTGGGGYGGGKPINPDDLIRPTSAPKKGGGKPAFDQDLDDNIPF